MVLTGAYVQITTVYHAQNIKDDISVLWFGTVTRRVFTDPRPLRPNRVHVAFQLYHI